MNASFKSEENSATGTGYGKGAELAIPSVQSWETRLCRASWMAAMASSRPTLGYSSRSGPKCRHPPNSRSTPWKEDGSENRLGAEDVRIQVRSC